MKKIIKLLVMLAVLIWLLHACFGDKYYRFQQNISSVVSVEVYENKQLSDNPENHELLATLEEAEYRQLLEGIAELPSNIPYDPPTGFGSLVLHIHYADGSVEIIGENNSIYIPAEGRKKHYYYNFTEAFNLLVSQYL